MGFFLNSQASFMTTASSKFQQPTPSCIQISCASHFRADSRASRSSLGHRLDNIAAPGSDILAGKTELWGSTKFPISEDRDSKFGIGFVTLIGD